MVVMIKNAKRFSRAFDVSFVFFCSKIVLVFTLYLIFCISLLLRGPVYNKVHEFLLIGPDLTTSTKVGGEINMYDDVVSNAIAFCSIVMKEARRVDPSHVSRCMVPLIQTLRLNLTRSFVSFIGPA